jgi:hypothetical protein
MLGCSKEDTSIENAQMPGMLYVGPAPAFPYALAGPSISIDGIAALPPSSLQQALLCANASGDSPEAQRRQRRRSRMQMKSRGARRMESIRELRRDINQSGIRFVMTKLDSSLSLLYLAGTSSAPEERKRSWLDAKTAYDTALSRLPGLTLNDSDGAVIDARLRQIRLRFERLRFAMDSLE